jgi:hypothetical protein
LAAGVEGAEIVIMEQHRNMREVIEPVIYILRKREMRCSTQIYRRKQRSQPFCERFLSIFRLDLHESSRILSSEGSERFNPG